MKPTISIIGLGWLGMPLAQHLAARGYKVMGSVSTPEKRQRIMLSDIETCVLNLSPAAEGTNYQDLFRANVLVVNIAPGVPPSVAVPDPNVYARQISTVRELALHYGVERVVFISATSVYPDHNGIAREADLLTEENTGSKSMLRAEAAICTEGYALTIVRLGGLIGYDRIPGRHFAGKTQVAGHPPVNYIHRDDAVHLMTWIIEQGLWGEVFNGVAPAHPTRKSVYTRNADLLAFDRPQSYENPQVTPWKEISADKLLASGFQFKFPDPLTFPYDTP